MNLEWWLVALFGWPGPILAVVLSIAGIIVSQRAWLFVAAVILSPFAIYLGANPRTEWLFGLPLLPLIGGIALSRGSNGLAWISILTLAAIVTWIGLIAMGGSSVPGRV
jgi:hypothetical protein